MKTLLPVASCLLFALLAFPLRHTAPAQAAQGSNAPAPQQGLEGRVATLETQLALTSKRNDETRALLEQTLAYLDKQGTASDALLGVLDESEKAGFAMGENWHSRELLLAGLRAYLGTQKGAPKVPAAPAPPPAVPVRPVRPVRK
jgi:hypothetical protein